MAVEMEGELLTWMHMQLPATVSVYISWHGGGCVVSKRGAGGF